MAEMQRKIIVEHTVGPHAPEHAMDSTDFEVEAQLRRALAAGCARFIEAITAAGLEPNASVQAYDKAT